MKLIVGLGNPGGTYARNRHNVGFRCLNHFARLHSIRFDHRECRARVGAGEVCGERLLLARPTTFVNLSGTAVGCLVRKHDIALANLLIVYDDLDLPLGKIRLRQSGGSGGHRGMHSIILALDSEGLPRIRVGIGRPQAGLQSAGSDLIIDHVLGRFSPAEDEVIKSAFVQVSEAIGCFLREGIEAAMREFN